MNLQIVHNILVGADKASLAMQEITAVKAGYNAMEKILCPSGNDSSYLEKMCQSEAQYASIRTLLQPFEEGNAMDEKFVRAAMLARFSTFLWGNSGVHFNVVLQLMHFLNKGIVPYLPMQIGEAVLSGMSPATRSATSTVAHPTLSLAVDAAAQVTEHMVWGAHLAEALTGHGMVCYKGRWCNALDALKAEGIFPLQLRLRDGDALRFGIPVAKGAAMYFADEITRMLSAAITLSFWANESAGTADSFIAQQGEGSQNNRWGQQLVTTCMRHLAKSSHRLTPVVEQEEMFSAHQSTENPASSPLLRSVPPLSHMAWNFPDPLWKAPQYIGVWYDTWESSLNAITEAYNTVDDICLLDDERKRTGVCGDESDELLRIEMEKLALLAMRVRTLSHARVACLAVKKVEQKGCVSYAGNQAVVNLSGEETVASLIQTVDVTIQSAWEALAAEALLLTGITEKNGLSDQLSETTYGLYTALIHLETASSVSDVDASETADFDASSETAAPGVETAEKIRAISRYLSQKVWELL